MKTATLALAFVAASSIAHADTPSSEPSTTLPEITVYPHPGALLIDRLSRQIITAIGSQARLPRLPQHQARAEQPDSAPKASPHTTAGEA